MRKLILLIALFAISVSLFAQNIEDIEKYYALQKWDDAKGIVDKFLASEKNNKNAKAWYYKGVIYAECAKLPKYAGSTLRMDAFDAFKKYQELDPKNTMMKDNENVEFFSLYNFYFDDAIAKYNAKKYDSAFMVFKDAMTIEQYVHSKGYSYKGFSFAALDTQLIQNIALSAYLAKKNDEAATYYQKLADAKIKGEGFLEIYQFLVNYFQEKKDVANRDKYIAIGKELYPENEYWCDVQLKEAGDDPKARFAKYDELVNGSCGSYTICYNYSAELFNYLYTGDKRPADYTTTQAKLETVIKKALSLKSAPEANMLMARHYYNSAYDVLDSITAVIKALSGIKGATAADVKKKNSLNAQKNDLTAIVNKKYEDMLPYAQAAYDYYDGKTGLKPSEKGNFKVAISLMQSYWDNKKDAAKIKFYQDKSKSLD